MWLIKLAICIAVIIWCIKRIKRDKAQKAAQTQAAAKPKTAAPIKAPDLSDIHKVVTWTDHIFSPKRVPDSILEDLEGETVELIQEPDNEYDANAVRVIYDTGEREYLLGYLYRGHVQDKVNQYINEGRTFEATVETVDMDGDPKRFIELSIDFEM